MIENEVAGDFVDFSDTESIAVTEDARYIAVGFSTTDTTISGAGSTPKNVALYDSETALWLFTKAFYNQRADYDCRVYFNYKQDKVLAQFSSINASNYALPSFAYLNFDGSSDGVGTL